MPPHGFTNLGGLDKITDARDVKLGAAVAPVYTFPPTLTNAKAWAMQVEYQGQQPACGPHAGCALEDMVRNSRFSPRWTWADVKTFDGWRLDSGTDNRSLFKSMTKTGVLDFDMLGNEVALSLQDYAHPTLSQAMKSNATTHSGYGYGFVQDLTWSGLKQFIFDHGPFILTVRVGVEWWQTADGMSSWQEKDVLPLRPLKSVVSGHFVLAHSYDEQYIYFLNSWSDAWGRKGHGYFGVNYMPWVNDGGTLFPLIFAKDLAFGMTDPDVYHLQKILNNDPRTQLAPSGPGSSGKETSYFGTLTKAAVIKFQALHSISPQSGYVGPLTRAVLNSVASF